MTEPDLVFCAPANLSVDADDETLDAGIMIVENHRNHAGAAMIVAAAALFLSSCGGAGSPELSVDHGELGVFNALLLFSWTPSASANIRDVEYTLDDGATWIPVGPGVSEFRSDAPLPAGS